MTLPAAGAGGRYRSIADTAIQMIDGTDTQTDGRTDGHRTVT